MYNDQTGDLIQLHLSKFANLSKMQPIMGCIYFISSCLSVLVKIHKEYFCISETVKEVKNQDLLYEMYKHYTVRPRNDCC